MVSKSSKTKLRIMKVKGEHKTSFFENENATTVFRDEFF